MQILSTPCDAGQQCRHVGVHRVTARWCSRSRRSEAVSRGLRSRSASPKRRVGATRGWRRRTGTRRFVRGGRFRRAVHAMHAFVVPGMPVARAEATHLAHVEKLREAVVQAKVESNAAFARLA